MKFISKTPPQYVWKDDIWQRDPDDKEFKPDLTLNCWVSVDNEMQEKIPFPKKTKSFG